MDSQSGLGRLIEPVTVAVADLPPPLADVRIAVVSDLHVRGARRRHEQIVAAVGRMDVDLLVLAGDYMNWAGDEALASRLVGRIVEAAGPRIGTVGVFGNHDTAQLRRDVADLPVRWLVNEAWSASDLPLTVLGVDCGATKHVGGDLLAALLSEADGQDGADAGGPGRLRMLVSHLPVWMTVAAGVGIDLVIAGHTHGGQVRLPGRRTLYNALDWPRQHSAGVLQLGATRAVVSRGLGEARMDGLRLFCPPHVPLVTLRRAEPDGDESSYEIRSLTRW